MMVPEFWQIARFVLMLCRNCSGVLYGSDSFTYCLCEEETFFQQSQQAVQLTFQGPIEF